LNVKHIKESLKRIQKYILNKLIEGDKANNVKDLAGIGEVAWGLFWLFMSPTRTSSLLTRIIFLLGEK